MGDLNARIGRNQQRKTETTSVRTFTVDVENENRLRLIDLCDLNNMIITNAFFNHKEIH